MSSVKNYIYKQVAAHNLSKEDAKLMLTELQENGSQPDRRIAIIGMAVKLPEMDGIKGYWEMLRKAKSCISDFPETRKADIRPLWAENEIEFSKGAYFQEVDQFDAHFFRDITERSGIDQSLAAFFFRNSL